MKKVKYIAACLLGIAFFLSSETAFPMDFRHNDPSGKSSHPSKRRKVHGEEAIEGGCPLDIQKVGEYFLMKDKERKQQGIPGAPMDRWKLQKLCYYAQGYFLALYDVPLFKEEMVAYEWGPYNGQELTRCYYADSEERKYCLDWPWEINTSLYTDKQKLFLDAVFEQKRMLTGQQLKDSTHFEVPWCETVQKKGISKSSVIDKPLMKRYFKNEVNLDMTLKELLGMRPEQQVTFINLGLVLAEEEKIKGFIARLKKQVGSSLQDEIGVAQFGDFLAKLSEHEGLGKKLESFDPLPLQIQRWPHQTFGQALASYLVFPQELEDLSDPVYSVYGREYVHLKLAYSARFGNTLAFYHLEQLLKMYNASEEEDDKGSPSALTEIQNYFHERFEDGFRPQSVLESQTPFYAMGLTLSWLGNLEEGRKYYEYAANQKDGRAIYQLALHEDNSGKKEVYCNQALALGYVKIIMEMAAAMPPEDALSHYIKAGEQSVAEGFYQAAKLLMNNPLKAEGEDHSVIIDYLDRAGNLGMLTAYSLAAELCIDKGLIQEAYDFLEKEGKAGNPEGFYKLAQAYENNGDTEKAKSYYLQSGKLSGYFDAARLEEDADEAEGLEEEADEYYVEHFQELKDIVEGE